MILDVPDEQFGHALAAMWRGGREFTAWINTLTADQTFAVGALLGVMAKARADEARRLAAEARVEETR